MNEAYIGLDVHQAMMSDVRRYSGLRRASRRWRPFSKPRAQTILQFLHGLRGSLYVTFEERTWAAWLYDLLKPHVSEARLYLRQFVLRFIDPRQLAI